MPPLSRTAFAVLCFGVFAGSACAETLNVTPGFTTDPYANIQQVRVGLTDLDLSTASGARIALARIEHAAIAVCGDEPDSAYAENDRADFAECFARAVHAGVQGARSPILMAMAHKSSPTLLARK